MALRVQYPVLGRRTVGVDARAKWFTASYEELQKRIATRFVRLVYVPASLATYPFYRLQMRLLEDPGSVTHIMTQMHSFLLRPHPRSPTVITCHDLVVPWTLKRLPLADRVIAPSMQVKEALERTVQLSHEPEVVFNALPPTYVPSNRTRKPRQILFVGTEQPRKNVEGLFRIFAALNREEPSTLVKVGVPSANRPRLRALEEQLGLRDRVVWRDFVGEPELINMYQTSTVTLVPSFIEGFSMVCLEAMATGCPLVATSLSAVPEVVGRGGVLLDPRDEAAWVDAILRIFRDEATARSLSQRGIVRSRDFSPVRSAAKLERIYADVLQSRTVG